jgi:hypothetical protein
MTVYGVRRDKAALFQWVQGPPGDSLQPEATGAGMEATKCLKPSDGGSRIGDRASRPVPTRIALFLELMRIPGKVGGWQALDAPAALALSPGS